MGDVFISSAIKLKLSSGFFFFLTQNNCYMHKIVSWYYTCVYCVGEREEVRERETDSQGNDENHRRWWNEVDFLTVVSEVSSQMTIKKTSVFMADEDTMTCHCLPCFSIVFVDKALTQDSFPKNKFIQT